MVHRTSVVVFVCALAVVTPAAAQPTYAVQADLLFYGDNTEFANPFRAGETILGSSGRVVVEAAMNDTVTIKAGFFGLGRFGAHQFLEHAEPVIALVLSRGASRFVFGSVETAAVNPAVSGPDRDTPHGLLPPLQSETLTFTRGQEMGLQWLVSSPRLQHDAWINWQRLNRPGQRERFDAGYRGHAATGRGVRLSAQWHLVHEGGQQFAPTPVSDSQAAALGGEWRRGLAAVDAHAVVTRHVPARERPALSRTGAGIFTRLAVEPGPWRRAPVGVAGHRHDQERRRRQLPGAAARRHALHECARLCGARAHPPVRAGPRRAGADGRAAAPDRIPARVLVSHHRPRPLAPRLAGPMTALSAGVS